MKTLFRIFNGLLIVIVLTLLAALLPIPGNMKLLVVLSGSMEPSLHTGSLAIMKPGNEYKIGDIITFSGTNGKKIPVTHRIVDIRVDRGTPLFITKGDANEDEDRNPVKKESIIGKAIFSIPYLGYGVEALKTPWGFVALIIIPASAIVYEEIRKIKKEMRRMKKTPSA